MSAAPITLTPADLADLERIAASIDEHRAALHAEIQRQQGLNAVLYAALKASAGHSAAAREAIAQTGLDQPRHLLDQHLDEAHERSAAAYQVADIALLTVEARVDLDGRTDVIVLSAARDRLRAGGRRA